MAIKQRETNRMKATIWSPSMKSEVDGPTEAVIELAFWSVATQERREKLIAALQVVNTKMTKSEAARAAEQVPA